MYVNQAVPTTFGRALQNRAAALSLSLSGGGVLTLTGTNTYTGATSISAGTLNLGNSSAVQNSTVTLNPSTALTFSSGIGTFTVGGLASSSTTASIVLTDASGNPVALQAGNNNASTSLGASITGSGSLVKIGAGTLSIDQNLPSNDSGTNTYSGGTYIKAGTLMFGTFNNNGITGLLGTGAIYLGDTGGTANATLQSNYGSYYLSNNIVVQSGNTGTATIKNYGGGLTIYGSITLGSSGDTGQGITFDSVDGGGNVNVSGVIKDPAGLQSETAGTVTINHYTYFSNANTYSGATVINANGTLNVNAANAVPSGSAVTDNGAFNLNGNADMIGSLAGSGAVTLGGGTLSVGNDNTSTCFYGAISGGGNLTKVGAGTLVLSGDNTYSGGTNVEAGTLIVNNSGAIPDGSSLTVGAGGAFIFDPTVSGSPAVGLSRDSSVPSSASVVAAVPEPGTIALFLAALWSAAIYRRFSRRQR